MAEKRYSVGQKEIQGSAQRGKTAQGNSWLSKGKEMCKMDKVGFVFRLQSRLFPRVYVHPGLSAFSTGAGTATLKLFDSDQKIMAMDV